MTASPGARGVVVLGMHRSGTSAITRAVNLLGLPLGRHDDLYSAPDNPSGHWESRALCACNDTVLKLFRGTSMTPPPLPSGWQFSQRCDQALPGLRGAFRDIYHGDRWLWKDPRLCLTLPVWRRVLPDFCVVLVLRDPHRVADSLHRREGFPLAYCLSIWDRYTRAALDAARGLPVAVVRFEDVLDDPKSETLLLAERLSAAGVELSGDPAAAADAIEPAVVHRRNRGRYRHLTDPLWAAISELPGYSPRFGPPSLPDPFPGTGPMFQLARAWNEVREVRTDVSRRRALAPDPSCGFDR